MDTSIGIGRQLHQIQFGIKTSVLQRERRGGVSVQQTPWPINNSCAHTTNRPNLANKQNSPIYPYRQHARQSIRQYKDGRLKTEKAGACQSSALSILCVLYVLFIICVYYVYYIVIFITSPPGFVCVCKQPRRRQ